MNRFLLGIVFLVLLLPKPADAALFVDEFVEGDSAPVMAAAPFGIDVPSPPPPAVVGEVTTPRFRLLYTARSEGSARELAGRIEPLRDAFEDVLGRDWPGVTEIRVALGREELIQLAVGSSSVPAWAEAVAYPNRNIILMDALSLLKPSGMNTLRHEMSHVALGQLAPSWPRWFQEGVAMYLTGDRLSLSQYAAMFRAVTNDRLFDFEDLAESWPQQPQDVEIAYAQSVVFLSHLVDRFGSERLGELIDHVRAGAPFEVAFARAFQTSIAIEQDLWEKDLPNRYSWMPIVTGGSLFWGFAAVLSVGAWARRRHTRALRYAEMAAQEAAEDAAQKIAEASTAAEEESSEDHDAPSPLSAEAPPRGFLH